MRLAGLIAMIVLVVPIPAHAAQSWFDGWVPSSWLSRQKETPEKQTVYVSPGGNSSAPAEDGFAKYAPKSAQEILEKARARHATKEPVFARAQADIERRAALIKQMDAMAARSGRPAATPRRVSAPAVISAQPPQTTAQPQVRQNSGGTIYNRPAAENENPNIFRNYR